jgi:hypothetical protein
VVVNEGSRQNQAGGKVAEVSRLDRQVQTVLLLGDRM